MCVSLMYTGKGLTLTSYWEPNTWESIAGWGYSCKIKQYLCEYNFAFMYIEASVEIMTELFILISPMAYLTGTNDKMLSISSMLNYSLQNTHSISMPRKYNSGN